MKTEKNVSQTRLVLLLGDITQQDTEAIVNAANSSLMGGGGVDGAIHRTGGAEILAECKKIVALQGQCSTGQAVITAGGKLKAKYVIHTVGPIWHGGETKEKELLASAYANSLYLAFERHIRSLSFPSISTGAYRFPIEKAAQIALTTIINFLQKNLDAFSEVRLVLFSPSDYQVYDQALNKLLT